MSVSSKVCVLKKIQPFTNEFVCFLPSGENSSSEFKYYESQKVKIQQIRSLSEDVRFYYKRLRGNKEDLEPGKKSKV